MLDSARGLSPAALRALAELEQRVLAADGGRLKLECGVLRSRSGNDVDDLLWWDGDRLVGFLGVYAFGPPTVELAGMVDPAWRRRGIAGALLDAALPLCTARGYQQALLVTPGVSAPGRAFAVARGAMLDPPSTLWSCPVLPPRESAIRLPPFVAPRRPTPTCSRAC